MTLLSKKFIEYYPFDFYEYKVELNNKTIVYVDIQVKDIENITDVKEAEFWVLNKSLEDVTEEDEYTEAHIYRGNDSESIYNFIMSI